MTDWLVEVVPTRWSPKVSGPPATENWLATPVPLSGTLCGELGSSSVMSRDALSELFVLGWNVTSTEQVVFGSTSAPWHESLVSEKSPWSGPLIAVEEMLTVLAPLFVSVSVTVCGALAATLPKETAFGWAPNTPAVMPIAPEPDVASATPTARRAVDARARRRPMRTFGQRLSRTSATAAPQPSTASAGITRAPGPDADIGPNWRAGA